MTFLELEIGEFWKASKTAKKKLKTLKILWIKDFFVSIWERPSTNLKISKR